jgi:hypothetical protein
MEGGLMASSRTVFCPICKKDIEVRSDFAHFTLNRHVKEHNK